METKLIGLILCDLLGVTGLGNGLINRIDSWKEAIIFILAGLYAIARILFYCLRQSEAYRREKFDRKQREAHVNNKQ